MLKKNYSGHCSSLLQLSYNDFNYGH